MPPNNSINVPLTINLIPNTHHNKPCLELRKIVSDIETIKILVSAAHHETPILIIPKFTDKLRALNSLIEKGLVYREGNEYFFTF